MFRKNLSQHQKGSPSQHHFPLIFDHSGWVTEGLLAAFFVGMALFILLATWVSENNLWQSYYLLRNSGIAVFVFLSMLLVYWWVSRYCRKRFRAGGYDPLMVRRLMADCIAEDCGELEKLFSEGNLSDIEIFKLLVTVKLQQILDHEEFRDRDLQTLFRKSRIKPVKKRGLVHFFDAPSEFDRQSVPPNISVLYNALPLHSQLEAPLAHLKACRRNLFTNMSDYIEIWKVTEEETKKIQQGYRYNPPEDEVAQNIVFVGKAVDLLKRDRQNRLRLSQQHFIDEVAGRKVNQLKTAVADYQNAWKDLVAAYETLSKGSK